CDYCAFATWSDRSHLASAYVDAVRTEADRAVDAGMAPASSVFFGGGTPSLLPAGDLASILGRIPRLPGAEVTVECNPEHVTADRLVAYRAAGVTRISLGVQSTVPHVLRSLGREHDAAAVTTAVAAAVDAGFAASYSVDVIFGAAGERPEDWQQTVSDITALDPRPRHVSAYGLVPEPGTPLGEDRTRHPDPDDQADKYVQVDEALSVLGLEWYEISNWAAPGAGCRHNRLYWRQGEYRGLGCAAHSHAVLSDGRARRWWNVRTPERYIRLVEAGESPVGAGEVLDAGVRAAERVELALRTREGVAVADLPAGADLDFVLGEGLVERDGDRMALTRRGRLLASEVTLRLLG
ncbi:MAG: coproporphyrinogen-III oxidase family protein, partial [Acidimicrobiales bacterium]